MRPPRNFDAAAGRGLREPQTRINERIRVREVLLIDETGENKGVTSVEDAQKYALEKNLDLVEISPQARPPVCRVMDYGKWKYEQNLKAKEARKHRSQITVKEIKFRPKIGTADYETKKNHVRRFLEAGDRVKVTIMFRGREVVHSDLGRRILERVSVDVADVATVDQHPNLEGRNMTMMLAPRAVKPAKESAAPTEGAGDDPMTVPESASTNGSAEPAAASENGSATSE
jgi:translation initiation factor IF-3